MTRVFNLLIFVMVSVWLTACGGGGVVLACQLVRRAHRIFWLMLQIL